MTSEHRHRHAIRFAAWIVPALAIIVLMLKPALSATWYVDGKYGHDYNPGSYSSPFLYFWQANQKAKPGDTIYLKPTTTYPTLYVSASGSNGNPITIAGYGNYANPTRVISAGDEFGVWIGASYITVLNLDVSSPGHSAFHVPDGKHHVTLMHNRAHDSARNGIDLVGTDYMTISYNVVYNNAKDTSGNLFASGISFKGSRDIDNNTGVKMRINGNIVFANTNVPNCNSSSCWANASDSDGSGIIIDNNRRTYSDNIWYRGRTLISNNVVYGNGGRGIHMYLSDHITVNSNTSYSNNQDYYEGNYRPGEITGDYVSDVSVYNNILYSDGKSGKTTGSHVPISFMYCNGGGEITIRGNLGYRPQNDVGSFYVGKENSIPVSVSGNSWGNPVFVNQTLDSRYANFRVKSWSPAVNKGLNSQKMYNDILGTVRTNPTSIGAYENPG